MGKTFDNYKLVNLGGGHYHLIPTGTSYGGDVRISFLPGPHIAIYGDLCPGREKHDNKGLISVTGKGEGWFRGQLSAPYLAEKFCLEQVFSPNEAEKYCREQAGFVEQEEAAEWMELADDAANVDTSDMESVAGWIGSLHHNTNGDSEAIEACYGYDVENLELLLDIQRAFARLVGVQNG